MERVAGKDPALYVIWAPVLRGDDLAAAQEAAKGVPDARALQYWDADAALAKELADVLGIAERGAKRPGRGLAWDVYLLYERTTRWSTAPKPAFWMHQLYDLENAAPPLDGTVLRQKTASLIAVVSPQSVSPLTK